MQELKRNDLLSNVDLEPEKFEIPEWKGFVYIRKLTAFEGLALAKITKASTVDGDIPEDKALELSYKAVVMGVCDSEGNNIFTDDDIPALQKRDPEVITNIVEAIIAKSNYGEGSVEDAVKN